MSGYDLERHLISKKADENAFDIIRNKNEAYDTLEKLSEHESIIGVYIYPYKTGQRGVTIELSSGRQIEGGAFVSLADAVKSAQDRLTEHFEADYEIL